MAVPSTRRDAILSALHRLAYFRWRVFRQTVVFVMLGSYHSVVSWKEKMKISYILNFCEKWEQFYIGSDSCG